MPVKVRVKKKRKEGTAEKSRQRLRELEEGYPLRKSTKGYVEITKKPPPTKRGERSSMTSRRPIPLVKKRKKKSGKT